jgi:hypothetical protein
MTDLSYGAVQQDERRKWFLSVRGVENKREMHGALRKFFSGRYLVLWGGHGIGGGRVFVLVGWTIYRLTYDDAYGTAKLFSSRKKLQALLKKLTNDTN